MIKLLKVQLKTRLSSMWFIAAAAICLLFGIMFGTGHSRPVTEDFGYQLEDMPYIIAVIVCGVLAAVFIGSEFQEGTVRSKLTMGYSKTVFYISQLLFMLIVSLILFLLVTVPYFLMAYKNFFSLFSTEYLIKAFGLILLSMAGCSVLFTLVCMSIRLRTVSIIICAALAFGIDIASSQLSRDILKPEYTEAVYVEMEESGNNSCQTSTIAKSTEYIEKPLRDFMKASYFAIPISGVKQAGIIISTEIMAFSDKDKDKVTDYYEENKYLWDKDFALETHFELWRYPAWLIPEMIVLTAAGVIIFRKRNLY